MNKKSDSFLWGAATSSHQVEGNNTLNDWWQSEQNHKVPYPSGPACDQWNRFDEDLSLIQELGHNAYRFSIEWSRVQPTEDEWDESAIRQYRSWLEKLRATGIEPVVTLHHFTNPTWFVEKGAWEKEENLQYYYLYVEKVVQELAPYVHYWITINEPVVYLFHGYVQEIWPPHQKNTELAFRVYRNMVEAHVSSYKLIHDTYKKLELEKPAVSFAKHVSWIVPFRKWNPLDWLSIWLRNWFQNDLIFDALQKGRMFFPGVFNHALPRKDALDFIALNYYTRHYVKFNGWTQEGIFGEMIEDERRGDCELNDLAWEVAPHGLLHFFRRYWKYRKPIFVTENGICTNDDEQRERFIQTHLESVRTAREEGIPVEGYLHWSLLDNFEWYEGYAPRFGIIEVDFKNFTRKIKKSAHVLTDLCRKLSHE